MPEQAEAEILLVEDNPTDLQLALHVFEENGLGQRLIVERDGAAALDLVFSKGRYARQARPALKVILLDLKLPKIAGLEVLAQIKADPLTRDIPVVVLSSSLEESDLAEAYRRGANSFVVKPVQFERLSRCIRDIGNYWLALNEFPKHTKLPDLR